MISPDFDTPRFLERAKAVTVTMPLYDEGTSVSPPSSGTYNLYDLSGEVIFTGAVTIPSSGVNAGIATRALLVTDIPATLDLSESWLEEWVLTMPDGSVETIRRDVYFCLRTLYPVVNERMLARRVSDLQSLKAPSATSFAEQIREAWSVVETKLIQAGKRPYLITNAWALKGYHMALTLAYIFEDASTYMGDGGRYEERAKQFREEAEAAWDTLQLEYDDTQSGKRGDATVAAGPSVIYTNRPPAWQGGSVY